jgi:hypothetical protein
VEDGSDLSGAVSRLGIHYRRRKVRLDGEKEERTVYDPKDGIALKRKRRSNRQYTTKTTNTTAANIFFFHPPKFLSWSNVLAFARVVF